MRIPFLAGWFDKTKDRTRIVVAQGRVPRVFPGPWRLEAVVRADEEGTGGEAGGAGRDAAEPRPPTGAEGGKEGNRGEAAPGSRA